MDKISSAAGNDCFLVVSLNRLTAPQRAGLKRQIGQAADEITDFTMVYHHLGGHSATGLHSVLPEALIVLAELLKSLSNLRMVVTFGVSAHLATIEAYGMPWGRIPFRPGKITVLPDGLMLMNLAAPSRQHLDTIRTLIAEALPDSESLPTA